jgi:hypothetical protein
MDVRITANPSHGMVARVDSESGIVGTGSRSVSRYLPAVWPSIASLRALGPRNLKGTAPEVLARARPPGPGGRPWGGYWRPGWQRCVVA